MLTDADLLAAQPSLRRYATALTRNSEQAEELLAIVNLRALEKRDLYDDQGNGPVPWLVWMMHNQWASGVIKAKRRAEVLVGPLEFSEFGGAEAPNAPARVLANEVVAAISELSPERKAVLLGVGLGYRYEDIAARIGVHIGTVRSRLSRDRAKLDRLLGDFPNKRRRVL